MAYKVIPIDEGEEPENLLGKLDEIPQPGLAKEIKEEKELGFEVPGISNAAKQPGGPKPKTSPPKPVSKPQFGRVVSGGGDADGARQIMSSASKPGNAGPMYTGGGMVQEQQQQRPNVDFTKIMQILESLDVPEGYEREMVIIGNQAYSLIEKKVKFLGTEKIEKAMEKITSLPEGVFFAINYSPRVLCENHNIIAIEFLKKLVGSPGKLKPKTNDPKELAKSFGMT